MTTIIEGGGGGGGARQQHQRAMPEPRIRAARRGDGGGVAIHHAAAGGGLFFTGPLYPGAVAAAAAAAAGPTWASVTSPEGDKENTPPPTMTQQQRSALRRRKSPLPTWYPRTPLRDITALVNVLEMRRARTSASLAQDRNQNTEVPHQVSLLARLPDTTLNPILTAPMTPPAQSCNSMKEIEQATKDYVKNKAPVEAAAAKRRTLMSMR